MDKGKIRKFYWLLGQLNMRAHKADILSGYGVESTKGLQEAEMDEILNTLQDKMKTTSVSKSIRAKRSIVLDLLTKLGVYQNSGSWARVNDYLSNNRIAGKLLFELNEEELKKLIKKLRAILKKRNEDANVVEYLTKNN